MRYDISKATAPAMPNLGKGTECIRLLLSQTSKDMHEPLVPMLFPRTWRTHQRCGISVPRPQLEGANGHDGQSGGRQRLQQGPIVQPRGGAVS